MEELSCSTNFYSILNCGGKCMLRSLVRIKAVNKATEAIFSRKNGDFNVQTLLLFASDGTSLNTVRETTT